jgi:hypothetical protein
MKKTLVLIFLISLGIILNAQIDNCVHTNTNWKSEKEAIRTIESESFAKTEEIEGDIDSWMVSAHYYSCNEDFGFLIVKGQKKSFVHQNVPVAIWQALKDARSKGGYYNFYIKNKFQLQNSGGILL